MGTKVQSKRYSTGYSSIWGKNEITSNDLWSLYHEDNAPIISQYCDSLVRQHLTVNGSFECDNEKVRQTILQHESMFRYQLQELHRLYGRQRELMNVFRRGERKKVRTEAQTSNFSPLTGGMFSEDAEPIKQASHIPSLRLVFGQSSVSDSTGSLCCFRKDKSMHAFPSRDDGICEPPKANERVLERRIIDPENPYLYIKNEEKHLEERFCGLSGVQSKSAGSIHESDKKSSFFNALTNNQNGDASSSSFLFKTNNELVDLNEPIPLEETTISGSASDQGNFTSNMNCGQRAYLSAASNSTVHPLWKDASLSKIKETNDGTCFNSSPLRNDLNRREQLTYDFRAKLMRPDTSSVTRDVSSRGSDVAFQSSQAESRKDEVLTSEQGKGEGLIKRKLFGVDIFESNDESLVNDINMVSCTNKFDELSSMSSFAQFKKSVSSSARSSFPSLVDRVSCQNGLSLRPQLNAKQSMGNSVFAPTDLIKSVDSIECLDWRSAKVIKTATITSDVFQADIAPEHKSADCQGGPTIFMRSPGYLMKTDQSPEQTRVNKNSYHLNMDSLQNSSQQFFKSTFTSPSSEILTGKNETTLPLLVHDSEERNIEVDDCTSTIIKCCPLASNKLSTSKDLTFASIFSKPTCLVADGNNDQDVAVEKVNSGDQPGGKGLNLEEPINNSFSHLRCHIDLNLSVVEEEAPLLPCLPTAIVKLAMTDIDLEVPTVLESEADEGIETLPSGCKEPRDELLTLAAEAIVALSAASGGEDIVIDATHDSPEATHLECLKWFVEVASSYELNDDSNVNWSEDGAFTEEFIPDSMDYFEFMTLKLKDAKSENYFIDNTTPALENQDLEETKVTALSRRPRRGQARKGRQHKDFQRDVLPCLISLSKFEVTEDFQTFEELLRATGCTWKSSLCKKSNANNGRRRRRPGAATPSQKRDANCSPLEQKPVATKLEIEDKIGRGWGKRIKRLPRQRHRIVSTVLPLKHD